MARVEDGRQAAALGQVADHDVVHLIIDHLSRLLEVDGVDRLVVTVILVAVGIFRLPSVARVWSRGKGSARKSSGRAARRTVEEERIVGSGVSHEPLHGAGLQQSEGEDQRRERAGPLSARLTIFCLVGCSIAVPFGKSIRRTMSSFLYW